MQGDRGVNLNVEVRIEERELLLSLFPKSYKVI